MEPLTPLSQAQHFVGHACRALYALVHATEETASDRPLYLDMYSAVYGVLVKLFPDEAVHAARTRAIALTGVAMTQDIGEDDTITVMEAIVEELTPPRRATDG